MITLTLKEIMDKRSVTRYRLSQLTDIQYAILDKYYKNAVIFMKGLRAIRKQRNLNQFKVATDLHISRESLSYYESGKRDPSLNLLIKMSEYFNVH